jgi:hypothetical protein
VVELVRTHVSANREGRRWQEFYTVKSYEYVYERFRDEIIHYGYDREAVRICDTLTRSPEKNEGIVRD